MKRTRAHCIAAGLVVCAAVAAGMAARAELPPDVYRKRQQAAGESLRIQVLSVETKETDEPRRKRIDVRTRARVLGVTRSKSGLKAGAVITIVYAHSAYKEPRTGPSEVPILAPGKEYPAFLERNRDKQTFSPAAGGYSFRVVR